MKIDLHAHSTWSDGSTPVAQVFEAAKAEGVDILALTDHDNTLGWAEAQAAAKRLGMGFIPGIEVTTRSRRHERSSFGVHMLAYLPDPANQALMTALNDSKGTRETRLREVFDLVSVDYALDWADVEGQLTAGGTWGRPSIAAALVARGHFEHTDDVFKTLWAPGRSDYYVPNEEVPETLDAIALIRGAGGVPIIAHPMARGKGPKPGSQMPREHFVEMIRAGLAGFEVYHRDVPDHAREWLIDLANEFDLILTGSSDYHGDRKHNVLGENTTSREMLDRIVAQGTGTQAFLN